MAALARTLSESIELAFHSHFLQVTTEVLPPRLEDQGVRDPIPMYSLLLATIGLRKAEPGSSISLPSLDWLKLLKII